MRMCIDRRRADMPRSLAMMDRLLARDLRSLEASDARALNAFFDFRRDVFYVAALSPDAKEASGALEAVVAGKDGLSPDLQELVAAALAGPDRRAVAVPGAAPRMPELQLAPAPSVSPIERTPAERDKPAR
jgi:hypothetical protein